jgi:hypothetical protein
MSAQVGIRHEPVNPAAGERVRDQGNRVKKSSTNH